MYQLASECGPCEVHVARVCLVLCTVYINVMLFLCVSESTSTEQTATTTTTAEAGELPSVLC